MDFPEIIYLVKPITVRKIEKTGSADYVVCSSMESSAILPGVYRRISDSRYSRRGNTYVPINTSKITLDVLSYYSIRADYSENFKAFLADGTIVAFSQGAIRLAQILKILD